jgi:hypothetical protein
MLRTAALGGNPLPSTPRASKATHIPLVISNTASETKYLFTSNGIRYEIVLNHLDHKQSGFTIQTSPRDTVRRMTVKEFSMALLHLEREINTLGLKINCDKLATKLYRVYKGLSPVAAEPNKLSEPMQRLHQTGHLQVFS